jgi:hypothetical protein
MAATVQYLSDIPGERDEVKFARNIVLLNYPILVIDEYILEL